jgi:hypothetical protein
MKGSMTIASAALAAISTITSALTPSGEPPSYHMSWHTVDGGGGTSAGATFALEGTIGQPDAGPMMSGAAFELTGGFWTGVPSMCPADITGSGAVDIDDLFAVISGWGMCPGSCPPHCPADVNYDCQANIDDLFMVIGAWGSCE